MRDLCINEYENFEPQILGQTTKFHGTLNNTIKSSIDSNSGIKLVKNKNSKHNRSQDFTGKNKINEKRNSNNRRKVSDYKKMEINQSLSFGTSTKSRQPVITHSQKQKREKAHNKFENESMLSKPG